MTWRKLKTRVRGSHQCNGPGTFGGTYDLIRRGEEVFCEKCGAGPLEHTNGTPIEFDYEGGRTRLQKLPRPAEQPTEAG